MTEEEGFPLEKGWSRLPLKKIENGETCERVVEDGNLSLNEENLKVVFQHHLSLQKYTKKEIESIVEDVFGK